MKLILSLLSSLSLTFIIIKTVFEYDFNKTIPAFTVKINLINALEQGQDTIELICPNGILIK